MRHSIGTKRVIVVTRTDTRCQSRAEQPHIDRRIYDVDRVSRQGAKLAKDVFVSQYEQTKTITASAAFPAGAKILTFLTEAQRSGDQG